MNISEEELRAMVRDAIARQAAPGEAPARTPAPAAGPHPSHFRLALVGGGDTEGRCLIEPAVPCNHCGYCQSLGH
jgi:hypothetical protein